MEEQNEVEGTSTEIRDPQAVLSALEKAKADAKRSRLEKEYCQAPNPLSQYFYQGPLAHQRHKRFERQNNF
jgi:hypothetical protein